MTGNRMAQAAASTVDAVQKELAGEGGERGTVTQANKAQVAAIVESWPEKPAEVAGKLLQKYGTPNEATETRLIWHAAARR